MVTQSTLGFGSKISYSSNAGATWVPVAQSEDLNSPEVETGKVKITNNDSPNTSQEYAPGILDPSGIDFQWIYTAAQQAALYTLQTARTVVLWKEIFPDGSGWTWSGWITKIHDETKVENEAIKGHISNQPTTIPTFVATGLS